MLPGVGLPDFSVLMNVQQERNRSLPVGITPTTRFRGSPSATIRGLSAPESFARDSGLTPGSGYLWIAGPSGCVLPLEPMQSSSPLGTQYSLGGTDTLPTHLFPLRLGYRAKSAWKRPPVGRDGSCRIPCRDDGPAACLNGVGLRPRCAMCGGIPSRWMRSRPGMDKYAQKMTLTSPQQVLTLFK